MSLSKLIEWSQSEFSHLPWRKNRSLYRTLVSEIMLQQTTVGTVKNHFERFLETFPTIESLALASEEELVIAWKGLGYYRRARNLKKIAEAVVNEHKGSFPKEVDSLMEIPGIGPYTANAIVGIGMDQRALAVDANLERVIARLYNLTSQKGLKLQKEIQILFQSKKIFTEKISFRALNEALMDLGRTYCQARKVSCELCPLKTGCLSFKKGKPLELPLQSAVASKKKSVEHELHLLRVYVLKKDKVLVYKKSAKEWLEGQYEVPTFILSTTDASLKQYPRLSKKVEALLSFKSGITKYKIRNDILLLSEKEFKALGFKEKVEWKCAVSAESNLSTTTLKGLKQLSLNYV